MNVRSLVVGLALSLLAGPALAEDADLDAAVTSLRRVGDTSKLPSGEKRAVRLLLPAPGRITLVLQVEVDGGEGGVRLTAARRIVGPDAAITIDVEDAEAPQVFPVPVDPEALEKADRMLR